MLQLPHPCSLARARVAAAQTHTIPKTKFVEACPPEYQPSETWVATTLSSFRSARAHVLAAVPALQDRREQEAMQAGGVVFATAGPALVATALSGRNIEHARLPKAASLPPLTLYDGTTLPPPTDWPAWYKYITGRHQVPSRKSKATGDGTAEESESAAAAPGAVPPPESNAAPPSTEAVASLSDLEATRLFRRVAVHIVHHAITLEEPVAAWLYAILLRLPEPLHPDTASGMRDLLRQLCEMRAWMEARGGDRDVLLACINTIIVVLCMHFGQGEPWKGSY